MSIESKTKKLQVLNMLGSIFRQELQTYLTIVEQKAIENQNKRRLKPRKK